MKNKKIILASKSPRRKTLLEGLLEGMKIPFEICPADVDESVRQGETPGEHTLRLAREKAEKAAEGGKEGVYVGADTIVVIDNTILGKPSSRDEAKKMLERLSGRTHTVVTAFCVLDTLSGRRIERAVSSRVTIKKMIEEEIEDYLSTGEPLDKAGAYAIQGIGSFMVETVEGSYTNVVGLPMDELQEALREVGVMEGHE
jgi:septum formation protein